MYDDVQKGVGSALEFKNLIAKLKIDPDLPLGARQLASYFTEAANEAVKLEGGINGVVAALRAIDRVTINPFEHMLGIDGDLKALKALSPELRTAKQQIDDLYKSGADKVRTTTELDAINRAYRDTNAALAEQKRRQDAVTASRKTSTAARKAAVTAEREFAQAQRNEAYLQDLTEEVRILHLATGQREIQLRLLNEERRVRQAVARLGDNTSAEQLEIVRKLVIERTRLVDINREEQRAIQRINVQYNRLGGILGSTISDAIDRTKSLKDAAIEVALAFAEAALQAQIMGSFSKDSKTGNFLASFLSSLFKAEGGGVGAGRRYIVGERGPEVLEMGSQNGQIIPNHRAFSGASDGENSWNAYVSGGKQTALIYNQQSASNDNLSGVSSLKMEIVHVHDKNGNFESFVRKLSGQIAGQAISVAAPAIVEQSVESVGGSFGGGRFDEGMAAYGATRSARAR